MTNTSRKEWAAITIAATALVGLFVLVAAIALLAVRTGALG